MYEKLTIDSSFEEELRVVDNGNYSITENRRYEMHVYYSEGTETVDHCEILWGWNKHRKPEGIYVDTTTWKYYRVIHLSHYTPR